MSKATKSVFTTVIPTVCEQGVCYEIDLHRFIFNMERWNEFKDEYEVAMLKGIKDTQIKAAKGWINQVTRWSDLYTEVFTEKVKLKKENIHLQGELSHMAIVNKDNLAIRNFTYINAQQGKLPYDKNIWKVLKINECKQLPNIINESLDEKKAQMYMNRIKDLEGKINTDRDHIESLKKKLERLHQSFEDDKKSAIELLTADLKDELEIKEAELGKQRLQIENLRNTVLNLSDELQTLEDKKLGILKDTIQVRRVTDSILKDIENTSYTVEYRLRKMLKAYERIIEALQIQHIQDNYYRTTPGNNFYKNLLEPRSGSVYYCYKRAFTEQLANKVNRIDHNGFKMHKLTKRYVRTNNLRTLLRLGITISDHFLVGSVLKKMKLEVIPNKLAIAEEYVDNGRKGTMNRGALQGVNEKLNYPNKTTQVSIDTPSAKDPIKILVFSIRNMDLVTCGQLKEIEMMPDIVDQNYYKKEEYKKEKEEEEADCDIDD
jgi:hypothetical protein